MLQAIIQCNYKGKLRNQTWENSKKPSFRCDFGPNLVPQFFFCGFYLYLMLEIVAKYHSMQFQGKLMNQTWENSWKTLALAVLAQIWSPNFFCKFYLHKMLDIVESYHCMQFQGIWAKFWPLWPKFGSRKFFFMDFTPTRC